MDQTMRQQIDRLSALLLDRQPEQIDNIVQEALDEAKQIVREALLQAILQRTGNRIGMSAPDCVAGAPVENIPAPEPGTDSEANAGHGVEPAGHGNHAPVESTPVSEPRGRTEAAAGRDVESDEPEDREAIRQEIEAIRRQLRTNEERLKKPGESQTGSGDNGSGAAASAPHFQAETEGDHAAGSREETAAVQAGTPGVGYYVYCVVSDAPDRPLRDLPAAGVDGAYPVEVLSCCGLRSVVSRVDLSVFDQAQLEVMLQDMDWVQEKAYIHQHVLETVMAQGPLVPMRFCSICRSEATLQEMLTDYRADFVAALTKLADCQEWAVKIFFEPKQLRTFTETASEAVQAFKARMSKKSDGAAYFMEKQLENLIKDEAESVGDQATQAIHERLAAIAVECRVGSLQDKRITGRKETMTLNGAYLVDGARLEAFKEELDVLRTEYVAAGGILDMSGPWPPYNFVMIGELEGQPDDTVNC